MTWGQFQGIGPSHNLRTKELDRINLPDLPVPNFFLAWRQGLRKTIATASGRPLERWHWVMVLEQEGSTMEIPNPQRPGIRDARR
eukprot:2563447-Heterocapsa_arctica.AAC.1